MSAVLVAGLPAEVWVLLGAVALLAIALGRMRAAKIKLEARLDYESVHDSLSGLPNRSVFDEQLAAALEPSPHGAASFGVLVIGLDDLKSVNDDLGHAAGDEVIARTAGRIVSTLREGDIAARLWGDEFGVILKDVVSTELEREIARLLRSIDEPIEIGGVPLRIRASCGAALGAHGSGSPESLLHEAELAMYAVKAAEKGSVALFDPKMRESLQRKTELRFELEGAIASDQLVTYYQPIVTTPDSHIVGLEALVRWNHPTRGLVPPSMFIPLAEESGLIRDIGRLVLERACNDVDLLGRRHAAAAELFVTVNVSPVQLGRPGFADSVLDILERTGLPPKRLVLEVVESSFVDASSTVIQELRHLRDKGVRIAVDDFGTGYSSLGYLQMLPIDVLKLDRFFTQRIDQGPEESAVAHAILRLARNLDLETVAEGVETPSQLAALQQFGGELAQGFLFSHPLPLSEIERHLQLEPLPLSGSATIPEP